MSEKKELNQEQLEKVSGGVPCFIGTAGGQSGNNPANDLLETLNETNTEIKGEVIL